MIANVPTAEDFFEAGQELLDFAWDVVAQLLKDLDEAQYFGVDAVEVSERYWVSARRRLTTAMSVTQQGIEFILKGKIAQISPYLLLADPPGKWPSPYEGKATDFSSFRTIDAQDLLRVHDTFAQNRLTPELVARFNDLREKRNRIVHSIDKHLSVHAKDVVDSLLFMHKAFFPDENWAAVRLRLLETAPESELGADEFSVNAVSWELTLVLKLLTPAQVRSYFGIDKKQRRYICPECYETANTDAGFDYKLALLSPNSPTSTSLHCLVCDASYTIVRRDCNRSECRGNVISQDEMCLTCGG